MAYVRCFYCGEAFNREKEPCEKVRGRRWAHKACFDKYATDEDLKIQIFDYVKELFDIDVVSEEVKRQVQNYLGRGYTCKGILNALKYFYDVQKHSIVQADERIGIVPYVYNEAQEFFAKADKIREINEKILSGWSEEQDVIKISIPSPQRQVQKRNLFSFLDEEESNGE